MPYEANIAATPSLKIPSSSLKLPATSSKKLSIAVKPEILKLKPSSCLNINDTLTISGKNFGSKTGKAIALGGHGIHVDLTITSWSATSIKVKIPNSTQLKSDKNYYVGIKKSGHTKWLSNLKNGIYICKAKTATLKLPATSIVSKPIKTVTPAKTLKLPSVKPVIPKKTPPLKVTPPASGKTLIPDNNKKTVASEAEDSDNYWYDDYNTGDYWYAAPTTKADIVDRSGSLLDRTIPPAPSLPPLSNNKKKKIKFEAKEVVVMSANMQEAIELAKRLRESGINVKRRRNLKNLGLVMSVLRVPANTPVPETVDALRKNFNGIWADTNQRFTLQGFTNNKKQFSQHLIKWTPPRRCDNNIRLGLIDTKINKQHPALVKQNISSKNFLSAGIPVSTSDHGTAIASLLVANGNASMPSGLLPNARLFAAEIFRQQGKQANTTAEWIVNALDWLLEQKVNAINLSLGSSQRNTIVELAINTLLQRNIPIIAAAGNNGKKGLPSYPAAQRGVIAVTAVDAKRKPYKKATSGDYINFAAPGVDIWSAKSNGDYAYQSGTSYAVPFVTAIAAIEQKKNRVGITQRIRENSIDLGNKGKDSLFGWGLVQWPQHCH